MPAFKPAITLSFSGFMMLSALTQAHAQDFVLGEILVLGSDNDRVESSATIDTIREHNRETVGAALSMLPGIQLSKVGPRNEQMIQVRGFDLRQVPVFVDGIPVYVPYDGYVDLGRFNTFDLARIDVAKGFSSMMHGPNTLGGAINLISRRPTQALEGEVGVGSTFSERGDNNGQRVYANVGGQSGQFYFQAGASYLDNEGFRLPDDFKPVAAEDGGERNNSANTDKKYNVKLAWTPNATDEYAIAFVSQQGEKGNPPYAGSVPGISIRYWQWPYWDKNSTYAIARKSFGDHQFTARVYYDTYKNALHSYDDARYTTQTRPYAFRSYYDDNTTGFSSELSLGINDSNTLRTSVHWKDDVHREANAGEPWRHIRDITDFVGAENTTTISTALTLVTGVAYERRRSLDAEVLANNGSIQKMPLGKADSLSWQAGLTYALSEISSVSASVAKRNRFATIKDRYSFRFGTAIPNPALKSESALHYDLSYRVNSASLGNWAVSVFTSETDNMIQSVIIAPTACTSAPCSQMQNTGNVRTHGAEFSVNAQVLGFETGLNYTWIDRENRSNPTILLIDSPKQSGFAYVTRTIGEFSLTASVQGSAERVNSSDGRQRASGFVTADIKGGLQLMESARVEIGISNLFDRLYTYAEGFPEAGRGFYANMNWSF